MGILQGLTYSVLQLLYAIISAITGIMQFASIDAMVRGCKTKHIPVRMQ